MGSYLKGRPIWCSWQLTPRCEAACAFCEHHLEGGGEGLDLAGCRRIVEQLGRLGSMMVSLSGGDPFLRSDLSEVVALLAQEHFVFLTTGGGLVTPDRARAVWSAGLLAASVRLDTADPRLHDEAVGGPAAHARSVAGLAALARARASSAQRVNVKVRLRSEAILEGLGELLRLAGEHGATVSVEPAFPLAAASLAGRRVADELRGLRSRFSHLRVSGHFLGRLDEAMGGSVGGCQAGHYFFNVDHRGRVSKCVEFRAPEDRVGDLAGETMGDVLPGLRQAHASNRCGSCWYSSRGEIEGLYTLRGLVGALPELIRG
jgi:MoaA/NifB/PqqE/SkfB family radical SAM enzyme